MYYARGNTSEKVLGAFDALLFRNYHVVLRRVAIHLRGIKY